MPRDNYEGDKYLDPCEDCIHRGDIKYCRTCKHRKKYYNYQEPSITPSNIKPITN